jgi:hypothetical protein
MRNAPASSPPGVPNAPLSAYRKAEHPNARPASCPRQQRGAEHSRSYSKTGITASQGIWMSRHTVPGTIRPLDSTPPHKLFPEDDPGLSAPERKARSQKPDACPRKLRESSCLSLRATRLAAAYRLRRSCHRPRGPIALPRSGCPVRRSRHPAALQCGRCLPLRIHSMSSSSKVCATRTSFIAPLASTAPRGRTRSLLLRHAARARRVPAKGRMGTPHTPFFAREACRRRNPAHTFSPKSNCCPSFRALPKAAGVREPRCPLPARSGFATGDAGGRVHRTRGLCRLARTGVVPGTAEERRSSRTPRWCRHYVLHVRRTRGFRPWPLPTQSGFELFRDAITQALRGQHLYVRHP